MGKSLRNSFAATKNIYTYTKKAPAIQQMLLFLTGNFLSSQGVATQVLSASECLTTVFGMGTGGTIQASSPDILSFHIAMFTQNFTEARNES